MKLTPLSIPDVLLLEPKQYGDERGFFSEVYNARVFAKADLSYNWVQINHSMSREKSTLRGLHFQTPPNAQAKLIRVTRGALFDVAVDLRVGSPTFGEWVSVTLSAKAWNQVLIPTGFAHGYLTLEPETEVVYKVDDYYAPEADSGVIWNDPDLAIDWPLDDIGPVLSAKDRGLPRLAKIDSPFAYGV